MNKFDFFINAMRAEMYRRTAWVISAFALIQESHEYWKEDPYPYRIVQTPAGHYFVDPEKDNQLTLITDAEAGQIIFDLSVNFALAAGTIPNLQENIISNYGNLLLNWAVLVYPLGDRIPYQRQRVSPGQLQDLVLKKFVDEPPEGVARDPDLIYPDEYVKFAEAAYHLENISQIVVPAGSEKAMMTHPDMKKTRERLYRENEGRLHDPAVIAQIIAELEVLDRQWLEDDPDAMGFYIKSKTFNTVRRKLFTTMGSETGFGDGVNVVPIEKPLTEGWDINAFPAMNDALRAGSYNRGALTMLGGVEVKGLLRAASNIRISSKDCGSRVGNPWLITPKTREKFLGFSVITPTGSEKLTEENIDSHMGNYVRLRSAMFCHNEKTDYCETCLGDRLSLNPTGLFTVISQIGSTMLYIFMSAAHSSALQVQKLDWKESIG